MLPDDDNALIIDCNHELIQKTTYWSIISDFNNIIHHKKVGIEFFNHTTAIRGFLDTLNWFTGMDPQIRALNEHVNEDPSKLQLPNYIQ